MDIDVPLSRELFRVRMLAETDLDAIITTAGGARAHNDADRRADVGADYVLDGTLIELKFLDEAGLDKPERQAKLAELFLEFWPDRPVVVLDRAALEDEAQRRYDRILEGPIKTAVAKGRRQLRQSRSELPDVTTSVLMVVNNGYTALDHDALTRMVAHRARQDSREIDGVIVAGVYFYTDGFDSFFLWPFKYVPINLHAPSATIDRLRDAWHAFSDRFMTDVVRGKIDAGDAKSAVFDMQFEVGDITFVKPAPPFGAESDFYINGRPRRNSSGLTEIPAVGLLLPELTRQDWARIQQATGDDAPYMNSYEDWLRYREEAIAASSVLQPFVPVPVTAERFLEWCAERRLAASSKQLMRFSQDQFHERIRALMKNARQRTPSSIVPSRYVLCVTEEIGQDMANDVSHIALAVEHGGEEPLIEPIVENVRIFHLHALALASAYALARGVSSVLWQKNRRYAWS